VLLELQGRACAQVNASGDAPELHGRTGTGPEPLESAGRNCTRSSCHNAENLCGSYTLPCQAAARIPQGPQIWISVQYTFLKGDRYVRAEKASLSREACEQGKTFLKIEYEGDFRERGPSYNTLGHNWAQVDVTSTWVTLVTDEACVQVEEYSYTENCINVFEALTAMCPCNGWDWSAFGAPRVRNLGAFCGQAEQCPILHEVYLSKPHYYSYKANSVKACFSRGSLSREVGWWAPLADGCVWKDSASTCRAGYLSSASRAPPVASWSLGLLLLIAWRS